MIPALVDHLWQSTLFVMAAALIATMLRRNGAHVRHGIWFIASMKFLVPLSLLMSLGAALPPLRQAPAPGAVEAVPDFSVTVEQITQPFSSGALIAAPAPRDTDAINWGPWLVAGAWFGGFVSIVAMRLRGWQRVRALLHASSAARVDAPVPVRSAPGLLEPGVVGLWRPVLLVPEGIETQLTPRQLKAVLLHELSHVQRRDNLTSALHMLVEAVFWFHPLVWFVGGKLVDERERACDEYVLRTAGDPSAYAESILNVCKLYVESPVACVSGVSGADMKKRVAAIMANRVGVQLNPLRKAALVVVALLAFTLPVVAGMSTAAAQQAAAAAPAGQDASRKFDVASVKPCEGPAPEAGRRGAAGPQASPGYLYLSCLTLRQLTLMAYAGPDHRLLNRRWEEQFVEGFPPFVKGGASWVYSNRFTIEARADGVRDRAVLTGPMLRTLLEDRFKLKHHRETEERTMLAMTVAKTGLKIQPSAPGSCVELDPANLPAPGKLDKAPCGMSTGNGWGSSELIGVMFGAGGRDGERISDHLWRMLRQPVADNTGLNGRYTFKLEFTPDDTTPGVQGRCGGNPDCMNSLARSGASDERPASFKSGASIFKALEDLGLKIDRTRLSYEFIVIDHAEPPSPDPPSPDSQHSSGSGEAGPGLQEDETSGAASAEQAADRFDVVSIKPCVPNRPPAGPAAPPGFRRGGAPWTATVSPGYAYWDCATLAQLVDQAYAGAEHPLQNIIANPRQDFLNQPKRVRGGPSWVESEQFTIEAKASVELTKPAVAGGSGRAVPVLPAGMSAALRAVLEDRFKVRVRRATEEQSMFALTIAKSGLNKQLITEPVAGDCMTTAQYQAAIADGTVPPLEDLRLCGRYYSGRDGTLRFTSFTLPQLARELSTMMDHYVLDKTAVTTPFNFTIKTDAADAASRETAFSRALDRMGLRLEPTKGQAEYLVIERAERPAPNSPSALR